MATIHVTQQHIAKGIARRADFCALALAITDVLGPEYMAWADGIDAFIFVRKDLTCGPSALKVPLPECAKVLVDRFDAALICHPQTFDLDIPPQYLKPTERSTK
jgi:hypothetical protein